MFERFDEKRINKSSKSLLKMQQNLYFCCIFYFWNKQIDTMSFTGLKHIHL
jgi:hypothetical protein